MEYIEEFDKLKTKVLKYILFKKRTEQEVRQKFLNEQNDMLEDVICDLKENGYINDQIYIEKAVKEYINLKNMSIREIEYKLMTKGIKRDLIDSYICSHKEQLLDYEINSVTNIINKKINSTDIQNISINLRKKGYMEDSIKIAMQKIEE